MYKSSYKDWVATYTFSLWSVLHQYIITVLLHWVVLYKLTFEIPTAERRYCCLYAHNLLNFSFSTLQFNPEDKTAGAIQGQILLFFWGILKGKEVRAQALPSSCWQLSSVAACIQLCGRQEEAPTMKSEQYSWKATHCVSACASRDASALAQIS